MLSCIILVFPFQSSSAFPFQHLDVSKNIGTPKWMVYNGKPYQNGMIWGIFPYFWFNTRFFFGGHSEGMIPQHFGTMTWIEPPPSQEAIITNEGLGWGFPILKMSCHPGADDCILGGGIDPMEKIIGIFVQSQKLGKTPPKTNRFMDLGLRLVLCSQERISVFGINAWAWDSSMLGPGIHQCLGLVGSSSWKYFIVLKL